MQENNTTEHGNPYQIWSQAILDSRPEPAPDWKAVATELNYALLDTVIACGDEPCMQSDKYIFLSNQARQALSRYRKASR